MDELHRALARQVTALRRQLIAAHAETRDAVAEIRDLAKQNRERRSEISGVARALTDAGCDLTPA